MVPTSTLYSVVYPRGGAALGSKTPTVPNRMKESWLVSFDI